MISKSGLKHVVPLNLRQMWRAYQERWCGDAELGFLKFLCERDKTSIDVGANRGMYTYWMLRYSATVVAIEPSPALCDRLTTVFGSRVKVLQHVASSENGTAILRVPIVDGQPEFGMSTLEDRNPLNGRDTREIVVAKRALDTLAISNVGMMKIDVEGHELAVLEGARDLLCLEDPCLLIEAEERHRAGAVSSVHDFLRTFGYSGFYLRSGKLHDIRSFDVRKMQDPAALWNGRRRQYINNFLFISAKKRHRVPKTLFAR